LPYKFEGGSADAWSGTDSPVVSPDEKWIAYGERYNLWALEVATGRKSKITSVGRAGEGKYLDVTVFTSAWAPDSRSVLYRVFFDYPHGDDPYPKRPAEYGFFVYSLDSGTASPVGDINGFVCGFAAKDKVLFEIDHAFVWLDPNTRAIRPAEPFSPGDGQVFFARDGKTAFVTSSPEAKTSRLFKLDLLAHTRTPITAVADYAALQYPMCSRSCAFTSYLNMTHRIEDGGRSTISTTLFVNGKPVFACHDRCGYEWVGDRFVAIIGNKELLIVEAATGKVCSRYALGSDGRPAGPNGATR
jgi:hypothetical protein